MAPRFMICPNRNRISDRGEKILPAGLQGLGAWGWPPINYQGCLSCQLVFLELKAETEHPKSSPTRRNQKEAPGHKSLSPHQMIHAKGYLPQRRTESNQKRTCSLENRWRMYSTSWYTPNHRMYGSSGDLTSWENPRLKAKQLRCLLPKEGNLLSMALE